MASVESVEVVPGESGSIQELSEADYLNETEEVLPPKQKRIAICGEKEKEDIDNLNDENKYEVADCLRSQDFESKLSFLDDCPAKVRPPALLASSELGDVLFVGTEWTPSKTNLELSLINRELAVALAKENFNVHCMVYDASEEEVHDAVTNGVTLILPDNKYARTDFEKGLTRHERLLFPQTYYSSIKTLKDVKFIIGHALPIYGTASAATKIRDILFIDATVVSIFYYIPENENLSPTELQSHQKKMEDYAKSAGLVLSLGSKIFDHFKSKLRVFNGIDHLVYFPYTDQNVDMQYINQSEIPFFEILTFHVDMEIKENDFFRFEMSAEIVGDIYRELRHMEIRWKVTGVSDKIRESFHTYLSNKINNKLAKINLYPPRSLNNTFLDLQQCHLVLYTGENGFGMPTLLAASVGAPFITSDKTGFGAFLKQINSEMSSNNIVIGEKFYFVDRIQDLISRYNVARNIAQKTKEILKNNAANGTIALYKQRFLKWVRKLKV